MQYDYDYIIIGSGFGGSVSALRLSEKGYKVLVVEKGKWFKAEDFAKTNWNLKKWLWIPALRFFGIMKITIFKHVAILSGNGVGGGSLVYANTLPIPKPSFYNQGSWSKLADWGLELKPFYQIALDMLGASRNPKLFDGDIALKQLGEEINRANQFEHPYVSVFFGKENELVEDPYFNGDGPKRAGCNFCGGCMTGCRHHAKNTLDKNYLHLAQNLGAEIRAEREVYDVKPVDCDGSDGYEVYIKSSTQLFARNSKLIAKAVIFSGGVLGTIKLMLKLKKSSLTHLSEKLGDFIRTNNETLISVSTLDSNKDLSKGVAIGSLLHTDDNSHLEVVRYSEGSGFWKLLHFPLATGSNIFIRLFRMIVQLLKAPWSYFKVYFVNNWGKSTAVLLFMQSIDSTLRFKIGFFGSMRSIVGKGEKPSPFIPESIDLVEKYSKIVGGKATSFSLETLAGLSSTAHILGGAVMGEDSSSAVINKNNEVFGYNNMYVIDGSMISANPGVNPALSITAIAERAMSKIPKKVK
ncbi:MAG: GMC family oxidoreductase [Cytophagia bacterium]|nr:GMC family oxidoreductase [Cytophagia bacterium]